MAPPPPEDAPLETRLGAYGGSFAMEELAQALLAPLEGEGLSWPNAGPGRAPVPFVFSVMRFGSEVDFDDPATRRQLSPVGAALAQVEEPSHAGAVTDDLGLPFAFLNRKHYALVSPLGAAHLVADQVAEGEGHAAFDQERVKGVLLKYFVPTLLALFQRATLHHAAATAASLVGSGLREDAARRDELRSLRHSMLEFAARGHFAQVSTRHALHRAYELTRAGLAVDQAWQELRRAVAELDAAHAAEDQHRLALEAARSAEAQRNLAAGMKSSLDTGNQMQHALHRLELFIFAVYSVHVVHMFIETLGKSFEAHGKITALEHLHARAPWLLAGALLCGLFMAHRVVSRSHRGGSPEKRPDKA
jgi:hypothetical protein